MRQIDDDTLFCHDALQVQNGDYATILPSRDSTVSISHEQQEKSSFIRKKKQQLRNEGKQNH